MDDNRLKAMIVSQDCSMREVMEVIDKGATNTAFLIDTTSRLVGIVTDGDIRRAILKKISLNVSIRTIMNVEPVTLWQNYSKEEVYQMMIERHLLCLPVINKNKEILDFVYLPVLANNLRKKTNPKLEKKVKNVFLIGGAGYIGSVLVRALLSSGFKVTVYDVLLNGAGPLQGLEQDPNFNLVQGDTRNIDQVISAIQGIDAVIHLGEVVGDPACQLNPDFTIDVNYTATKKIAEACCHLGISRFLFASSCSVYGAGEGILSETSVLNPVSLYSQCKIEAERALLSLSDPWFCPTIFRLATVFGLSYRPRFDLVVNLMIATAIKTNKIKVIGGEQWRPFVHVRDISSIFIQALHMPIKKIKKQVFNLGYDKNNHQIFELAEIVSRVIPGLIIERYDSADTRNYKVSFQKLYNTFLPREGIGIKEGVRELIEAFKQGFIQDYTARQYSNFHSLINEYSE